MKRSIAWQLLICGLILGGLTAAQAQTTGLADWCFNVNGSVDASSVTDNPSNACNGGTNAALASLNTSSWDSTLESFGPNSLGTAVITLGVGVNNVAFYADYDLDYFGTGCGGGSCGSFDDTGAVVGTAPAGVTYELDDPNSSNIFGDFAANSLLSTNNVGISGTDPQCCDVSWALGISNITVAPGGSGTVTFTVSSVAPETGFYLQQTSTEAGDSIYLTESVNLENPVGGTPEPSTALSLGLGVAILAFVAVRAKSVRV